MTKQRMPRIAADELLRALARDGWEQVRPGKHIHLRHPTKPATLKNILVQAGLSSDDLRALL